MKLRCASIMALILALFIVSAGIARSQLLVCRYQCAQDRQGKSGSCCGSGAGAQHHAVALEKTGPAGDCPHVEGAPNFSDISFTSPVTNTATAKASFPGGVFAADIAPPAATVPVKTLGTGVPPPGITTLPRYRLHCALLI